MREKCVETRNRQLEAEEHTRLHGMLRQGFTYHRFPTATRAFQNEQGASLQLLRNRLAQGPSDAHPFQNGLERVTCDNVLHVIAGQLANSFEQVDILGCFEF